MRCFVFCEKSLHRAFLIFYMKLEEHKGLKLTYGTIFGRKLFCDFKAIKRDPKWTQNEVFMYYEK